MKLVEKRCTNGRDQVYLLGIRIFSYKKKNEKKKIGYVNVKLIPMNTERKKSSLLYRFFTYPLAVYSEYKRIKSKLKS